VATAAGVALAGLGASLAFLPILVLLLLGPTGPFHRPGHPPNPRTIRRLRLAIAGVLLGWIHGAAALPSAEGTVPTGPVQLDGWLEAAGERSTLLHGVEGVPSGGQAGGKGAVRLGLGAPLAPGRSLEGRRVTVWGQWVAPWRTGLSATVRVDSMKALPATRALFPSLPGIRLRVRASLRERIHQLFPTHAGLVSALIIADRSGLDPGIRQDFTRTGTAHLLAISGFHVGVLAGWIVLLLGAAGLDRRRRVLVAAGCVWGYVALIGFPTSAVRAALLISALAMGRVRGRPVHLLGAWGAALLVVALTSPEQILAPGTQLSFAGSLGLLVWARPWGRALGGDRPGAGGSRSERIRYLVGTAVGASAAAQIMTLPFVILHFQRVALLGLPASVIATPPVAFALPGVLLTLLLSLIPGGVHLVIGAGVEGLLAGTVNLIAALARLDGGLWLGPYQLGGGLFGLLAASAWRWRGPRRVTAALAGAGLVPVLLGIAGQDRVEVHLLDVGQGDAIAIRTPSGGWLLVDAGPGPGDGVVRALVQRGATGLQAMVLTHPDLDHIGGAAEVVRQLPVDRVLGSGLLRGTSAVVELAEAVGTSRTEWATLQAGDRWRVDGVEFTVLHAGGSPTMPPNDHSVVIHLRYGDFDMLLTGDVGSEVEDALPGRLSPGTRVEVLKLAHHGSRTSSSMRFLEALAPVEAVVSLGRDNRFGHPAPEVVARLGRLGIPLARTDQSGPVRVRGWSDGSFEINGRRSPTHPGRPPGN